MKTLYAVTLSLLLSVCVFTQTVTVGSTSYQTWKGWEATAQAGQDNNATLGAYQYPSTTYANYKTALLAAMADLGINRFRVEFGMSDVNATGYDTDLNNAAIQPSTATSGQWHYDRVHHAMDDLIVPYMTTLAAQGETPYIVLCLVDFKSAGYQAEAVPSEYAYLVDHVVADFYSTYGFLPNAIESILERDNQAGSAWTTNNLADDIVAADALLVSHGYTGIKWITPSDTSGPQSEPDYVAMKAHNAGIVGLVNEIGYHQYVGMDTSHLNAIRTTAEGDSISAAMLECGGNVGCSSAYATLPGLYNDLIEARVSAWEQYVVTFPYPGEAEPLDQYFHVNTSTWAVTLNPAGKYFRSFFKYVRRGAVMKSVTNSSGNFLGVPFVNSNGTQVVVVKAATSGTVTVDNLPAGTYNRCVTIGDGSSAPTTYDSCAGNVTVGAGGSTTITFSGAGVGTVYDVNYLTPTLTCHYFFSTKISGCP